MSIKKIAFVGLIAFASQLPLYAANCPAVSTPDWVLGQNPSKTNFCPDSRDCVVQWKGYGWWTNFHANPTGYFFESNQAWDPRNVTVDKQGRLALKIRQSDLGGPNGPDWTAAEAVLVSQNNSLINIGYGHYLVTFETPVPMANMDPATVFGAFTYFRDGEKPAERDQNNLKELDMLELSKWGWNGKGVCPFQGLDMEPYGCFGSAQLGSQPWEQPDNLKRFPEKDKPQLTNTLLTIYMYWENANTPVKYKVFNGSVDMQTAQNKEGDVYNWTLKNTQYVPSDTNNCVRFHLNFYRPVYSPPNPNISIIPKGEQNIYVLNFEYKPK